MMHICTAIKKNCWNLYDSYGEICVHCGCCSSDPKVRAKARLEVMKEQLDYEEHFDAWCDDPKWRAIQEKNLKSNMKHYKKQIRYYTKRLEQLS